MPHQTAVAIAGAALHPNNNNACPDLSIPLKINLLSLPCLPSIVSPISMVRHVRAPAFGRLHLAASETSRSFHPTGQRSRQRLDPFHGATVVARSSLHPPHRSPSLARALSPPSMHAGEVMFLVDARSAPDHANHFSSSCLRTAPRSLQLRRGETECSRPLRPH
ncbi:hypothetical protein BAUCODRAFT_304625 [Baudoinia panamericana UAMH 10762]|uniref:Uncharacterized protein n=1 Tax=Baudoinia panamericana (strain UAMH 10762) TaxID=717646 RepID=M2M595_BAUPA|nr:uncharacterized protein BAUCODRAFT_304625 [Baudoinia panamericana UAMH 10762]EMC91796.1 hypothetical protein BAUCODRAFT_304625 [Baudoinia panamericana UAMH 10762]